MSRTNKLDDSRKKQIDALIKKHLYVPDEDDEDNNYDSSDEYDQKNDDDSANQKNVLLVLNNKVSVIHIQNLFKALGANPIPEELNYLSDQLSALFLLPGIIPGSRISLSEILLKNAIASDFGNHTQEYIAAFNTLSSHPIIARRDYDQSFLLQCALVVARLISLENRSNDNFSEIFVNAKENQLFLRMALYFETHKNLAKIDLSQDDLTNFNFTGANLTGANLTGAKLGRQQIEQIIEGGRRDLSGVDLTGVDLTGVNFSQAEMDNVVIDGKTTLPKPQMRFAQTPPNLSKLQYQFGDGSRATLDDRFVTAITKQFPSFSPGYELITKKCEFGGLGNNIFLILQVAQENPEGEIAKAVTKALHIEELKIHKDRLMEKDTKNEQHLVSMDELKAFLKMADQFGLIDEKLCKEFKYENKDVETEAEMATAPQGDLTPDQITTVINRTLSSDKALQTDPVNNSRYFYDTNNKQLTVVCNASSKLSDDYPPSRLKGEAYSLISQKDINSAGITHIIPKITDKHTQLRIVSGDVDKTFTAPGDKANQGRNLCAMTIQAAGLARDNLPITEKNLKASPAYSRAHHFKSVEDLKAGLKDAYVKPLSENPASKEIILHNMAKIKCLLAEYEYRKEHKDLAFHGRLSSLFGGYSAKDKFKAATKVLETLGDGSKQVDIALLEALPDKAARQGELGKCINAIIEAQKSNSLKMNMNHSG